MALTRAQLLAGNDTQGTVLSGQVQAVTAGSGILISNTGVLSINSTDPAFSAFVRTNAVGAFNSYIWPGTTGAVGQQLTLGAGNTLVWSDPGGIPWTAKGQLVVGTGVSTDLLLNAGVNGSVLRANSATASGLEWGVAPPAVIVSGTAPTSPEEGQLWYDCNTGYLKIYQSCVAPAGWTNVPEPGLPVNPTATSASPAFVSGTGVTADPYICTVSTAFAGSSVFVANTVTVTGLAPNQFVPIVDLDAVLNGGRFSFSNNYANATGTLVFQTIFTDLPASPPLTSYTARIRVGYASSYIEADVNVIEVLSVTSGSIAGNPNDGATLTYTPGVASGGIAPVTTSWVWKRQSDNSVVTGTSPDNLTITVPPDCVGDRIYVQITATDSSSPTPMTATADTAFLPNPPAVIGPSFSITSAGSIAGTAQVGQTLTYTRGTYTGGTAPVVESWVWYRESDDSVVTGTNPNDLTITIPSDCSGDQVYVKYTVTDSSAPPIVLNQDTAFFPTSPSVITGGVFPGLTFDPTVGPTASPASVNANGLKGTATATWPAIPATTSLTSTGNLLFTVNNVGPAGQGPTNVSTGNTVELTWDPAAITAAADNATLTGTLTDGVYTNTFSFTVDRSPDSLLFTDLIDKPLSTAAQSNTVTPAGFTVPISLSLAAGTPNSLSVLGVSINSTAFVASPQTIVPGDTIRLQGTTGAGYTTAYGVNISLGSGPAATDTWTVTTTANVPAVDQPTITAPVSGATGINPATNTPPATATVTGSAYNPLNGALGQQSADWEVYKGSYPLSSTNAITAVTQDASGPWVAPTSAPSANRNAVGYGAGVLIAVGNKNTTIRSTDFGETWVSIDNTWSAGAAANNICNDNNGNWLFGTNYSTVGTASIARKSLNNGLTWESSGASMPSDWRNNCVSYVNGEFNIWQHEGGSGKTGTARRVSRNGMQTWSSVSSVLMTTSHIQIPTWSPSYYITVSRNPDGTGSQGIRSSVDNLTWTSVYAAGVNMNCMVYGNGTAVAVGASGRIVYSTNGTTWTVATSGTTKNLNEVTFGNNQFTAVGATGTILTSPDGITWTASVSGVTTDLYSVTATPKNVVTVGNTDILISPPPRTTLTIAGCASDGFLSGDIVQAVPTTANAGPATISTLSDSAVTVYPQGTGWAIGQTLTRTQSQTLVSTNAITAVGGLPGVWAPQSSGTTNQLKAIGYNGVKYLAGGSQISHNIILRSSTDGISWTTETGPNRSIGIVFGAGVWVSVGCTSGTARTIFSSPDGVTWTQRFSSTVTHSVGDPYFGGVVYTGTQFVTAGGGGFILTSPDGITWTTRTSGVTSKLRQIAYNGSTYTVVGESNRVLTSPDSITWTIRTPSPALTTIWGVAYGSGLWVICGDGGDISTSPDGITWTAQTSGVTTQLNDVTYANGAFLVAGDSGVVLTSVDGVNWVNLGSGQANNLWATIYAGGKYLTVGEAGTILLSVLSFSQVKIAGALNDGFVTSNTVTSDPAAAGPADITALSNIDATLYPYSASWAVGQKLKRTTDQYLQIVPPPANPNTTNLTSINIPQASLLPSTKYWARVRYTSSNPVTSPWSAWSSFTTASSFVPAIGAALGGGFYAGQIKVFAGEDGGGLPVVDTVYNLIVAPRVSGSLQGAFGGATDSTVAYKTASTADSPDTVAQNAVYGGNATSTFGNAAHPAFNWAKNTATGPNAGVFDLTNLAGTGIGGYNDWYIPAENELQILYRNLKPTTTANVTTTGINPNAVPPTTANYTTTNPAQTTVVAFQTGGTEVMGSASPTLSSTEVAATPANRISITFTNGTRTSAAKLTVGLARAIRRVKA